MSIRAWITEVRSGTHRPGSQVRRLGYCLVAVAASEVDDAAGSATFCADELLPLWAIFVAEPLRLFL